MPQTSATTKLRIGARVSGHLDAAMAAEYAAGRCAEAMGTGNGTAKADVAVVFLSMHHADAAGAVAHVIRKKLEPRILIGCSAEAVIGGEIEMENSPGVSVFAATM